MEIASQEDPIPINTSYGNSGGGHGNMNHHHHANSAPSSLNITTSNPLLVSSNSNGLGKNHDHSHHHHVGYNIMVTNIKKEKPVVIKYKECLKNHAATMGGNAIDGCGEFMPSGEEGSIEALTCSVCNCHRNFHRRETEGEEKTFFSPYLNHHQPPPQQRKLMFHHKMIKSPLPQQMIMPIGVTTAGSNSESEDLMEEEGGGSLTFRQPPPPPSPYSYGHNQKKRFRTKFTQEQKEKMISFAERVGWKIQRQEESVVQQLCQEIGIRRRVLKVWMHNNKQNLSKKSNNVSNNVDLSAGNNDITENLASTNP
ncbi:Zinc-finger homeodomain protein 3 [Arabidopsis thaliana]|jgi:ZF-HD class homeobox domain-containing protein|uniref:Zinc-finger homeodomain protein 3 n=4 Tax=Arabidopsis TaxID=3701 RepID=ZHD3_ARATH|nr:homeobox protein 21 [Arabidopsis thaliana]NP_178358.1 homeobox protein 21 [Arabidopsis thaliana]O64722.1 RecName: Full=Zinc-finger homeodomain protein 3; Short=AtZHD3; AltName: Full=Homeobox protein 21; Short=AtHB-21; AltName: Full=Zinc finger homeodomain transcription factor 4 [Arabidopsis thaliana]KAG7635646.1 Homeobox-like domain superfamily [Arabidopsis thaliana x Arabidopsis arenosa]KAG7640295.1 Homeobox-like domain superfamily [Arabidopsis suecica]AAC18932.1 hypothetical protein [Arab|eukprot:NP_001318182.1 homeobox protein 21 [Arabidopsis thaliana]